MGIYDVESVILALEQLNGSFTYIGAHLEFEKPEFVMPITKITMGQICLNVDFY